ncbi:MAG: arsenite methyltransferase [Verrucomicrobiae bacterium]|nr:arsenite methyltransferase [Verrucomicrobiae bacterium]
MSKPTPSTEPESVREKVRAGYGKIAQKGNSRRKSGACCCGSSAPEAEKLAQHIGYSADELAALPEGTNMGLSCGNPNALAALQLGEAVLDLGAGAGFDIFIAGRKVGATGRAIGVDMTTEMLAKARKNIAIYRKRTGLDNVEFRLGEIEHLPLADASVDAVISNCVINLSPDKPQVWREIARVLKPGGRVAVSDLALLKPLPPKLREMVEALVGCIAGAVLIQDTEKMAKAAGLVDLVLTPKPDYVNAMTEWNDPLYRKIIKHLPSGAKPSDYITSLEVKAHNPSNGPTSDGGTLCTPAVMELIAIGAGIAANCEPCFKYHYGQARKLGVSAEDMKQAVELAQTVKQAPARAVLELAQRFLHGDFSPTDESKCCPGTPKVKKTGNCCG